MDFLINIPGPMYLIYFSIFSIAVIIFAYRAVNADSTDVLDVPEPTRLSPLDIAVLKNGGRGAILLSVFTLLRKNAIEVFEEDGSVWVEQLAVETSSFNPMEKAVYRYASIRRSFPTLFFPSSIPNLAEIVVSSENVLIEKGILQTSEMVDKRWKALVFGAMAIVCFSGVKMYLGYMRNMPISFLVLLTIVYLLVLLNVAVPKRTGLTALGRKFLTLTQTRFEWMNKELAGDALLSHKDMPYCVAYFGPAAFYGTSLESLLWTQISNTNSGNSGAAPSVFGGLLLGGFMADSFGDSDSDSGYDGGGFSDSGSSDGGSGCGGCGGGCGGGD